MVEREKSIKWSPDYKKTFYFLPGFHTKTGELWQANFTAAEYKLES